MEKKTQALPPEFFQGRAKQYLRGYPVIRNVADVGIGHEEAPDGSLWCKRFSRTQCTFRHWEKKGLVMYLEIHVWPGELVFWPALYIRERPQDTFLKEVVFTEARQFSNKRDAVEFIEGWLDNIKV